METEIGKEKDGKIREKKNEQKKERERKMDRVRRRDRIEGDEGRRKRRIQKKTTETLLYSWIGSVFCFHLLLL